jgi:hypothetical protein
VTRAAALVLVTFLAPGAAVAQTETRPPRASAVEIERGRCVKRSREDQRACLNAATVRCRETFETDLVGCFKSAGDCARKCLDEHTKCRAEPTTAAQGCKLACGSDMKVAVAECRKKADQRGCEEPARLKALQCKQRCTTDNASKLQQCTGDFDDCIGICVRAAR